MSLITKIPGVTFTDSTLPKLYRDPIITLGTKFVFDGADTFSYAKQATPVAGVDAWVDLSPNNTPASFGSATPFAGGGFTTSTVTGISTAINLPSSGKNGTTPAGFLFVLWMKYLAASSVGYAGFAGLSDNTNVGTNQYSIDNGSANSGIIRLLSDAAIAQFPGVPGTVYQLACGAKKANDGTYQLLAFANGALLQNYNPGRNVLGQASSMTGPVIGASGGFSPAINQKAFRCWYDDTSALADVAAISALVHKDYSVNVARFS